MEGVSTKMDEGFGTLNGAMGSVKSDVGVLKSDVSANKKEIKTIAGSVRDTLGVVGTLAGEVESSKKVSFAGSASAGSATAQAQAAPDTAVNRSVLSGALKQVNKFLDKQGGST